MRKWVKRLILGSGLSTKKWTSCYSDYMLNTCKSNLGFRSSKEKGKKRGRGIGQLIRLMTWRLQVRILSPPNQWNIVHRDRRPVPTRLQNGASVQSWLVPPLCRVMTPVAVEHRWPFLSLLNSNLELLSNQSSGFHSFYSKLLCAYLELFTVKVKGVARSACLLVVVDFKRTWITHSRLFTGLHSIVNQFVFPLSIARFNYLFI